MRVPGGMALGLATVFVVAAAAGLAQAVPAVITGCVSKVDGSTRIVAEKSECFLNLETVEQWNQAVAAPAGGGTVQGVGNVLLVPLDRNDSSTGLYFVQAMATLAREASGATPFEVILGPGTYLLPSSVIVPPFVSIRGAGMNATILSGAALTFTDPRGQVKDSFDVADLTIARGSSNGTTTINVVNAGSITFDHVFTDGIVIINNREPDVSIVLTSSIFKFPLTVNAGTTGSHVAILSTEVDTLQSVSGGMSVVCSGVYNASGALYGSACQPPASGP